MKFLTVIIYVTSFQYAVAQPVGSNQVTQWARVRTIDIKNISLDLNFDWKQKQALGVAAITLSPLRPLKEVRLDAAMMLIESISLQGGGALKFMYDSSAKDDALRIELSEEITPEKEIILIINYRTKWVNAIDPNYLSGSNGKGLRFSMPTYNDPVKPKELWSMGEAQSNRYWFPGFDSPGDLRTTELRATVEKNLTVISNGDLAQVIDNSNGTHTFHWRMDIPYTNYLTSLVIGEYVDIQQRYNEIELHNFGYPREAEGIRASVERLPDMMKFFSEKTGVGYPYGRYSQVFVQDLPWGVGNTMVATQSENMVDDKGTHDDFLYLWDGLEGETLANQWFGNYVSFRDWSDVWLSRGFAHYFDGLYSEYKNGKEEFQLWHRTGGDLTTYFWEWNSGVRHPLVTKQFNSPYEFVTFDNQPNVKGALVLHMMRKHLGDGSWWKAIHNYLEQNGGRTVTSEDFRKAVQDATGEPMDWFFDQWIYKMGHPVFEVTKAYDPVGRALTLSVKQVQRIDTASSHPQVEFFQGKVDVEIDGSVETLWLDAKRENKFVFAAHTEPRLVNFDYEGTWIKELTFEKPLGDVIYQLKQSRDVYSKRQALTQLVAIAKGENTSSTVKQQIYTALREVIVGHDYWRLRQQSLGQLQMLLAPASEPKPPQLDALTTRMLLAVIKNDKSWTRAAAIGFLGRTCDPKYAPIYLNALKDPSDRVVNQAAVALGKNKDKSAYMALVKLVDRPSWKNQSLMSALNGLRELKDPRGYSVAINALKNLELLRWRLPTPPVWDLRVSAVETIVALGQASQAYPLLLERFNRSMTENDLEGIFNNALLIVNLGEPKGVEIFQSLRAKYKDDANSIQAIDGLEKQFNQTIASK